MKTLSSAGTLVLILTASSLAFLGCKSQSSAAHSESGAAVSTAAAKAYPLEKCVVSGEALESGKTYNFVYQGQEVKLCCKDCLADFNKDPDKYMAKIAQAK